MKVPRKQAKHKSEHETEGRYVNMFTYQIFALVGIVLQKRT